MESSSHKHKHSVIYNYFSVLSLRPDSDFFQKMVENENEIMINKNNQIVQQELCNQYKKAIECFAGISNEKVDFFTNKLNQILISKKKEKSNKQGSKWSQYIKKKKEHVNHLMMFLQMESTKPKAQETVEDFKQALANATELIHDQFDRASELITLAKRRKRPRKCSLYNSVTQRPSVALKNNKIEGFINDFLKKFHYVYMHSKIFETPIEIMKQIMDDIYEHKIVKYFYYQEQIKQFQMLLSAEEGTQHQEGIMFMLQDLQNERAQYLQGFDDTLNQLEKTMNTKCIETNIESDILIYKYKNELLNHLAQIFK